MLILASASPRRRELLTQAGYTFEVDPANVDETPRPNEPPIDFIQRVAIDKARVVRARHEDDTVIAADTTVVFEGQVLNKPSSPEDAARMLRTLSCGTHEVHTAVVVLSRGKDIRHVETTEVTFLEIPLSELAAYVRSGEPLDKAGAYGIQGYASRWIPRIDGDYFNVMGLPICAVVNMLSQAGMRAAPPTRREQAEFGEPEQPSIAKKLEAEMASGKSLLDSLLD